MDRRHELRTRTRRQQAKTPTQAQAPTRAQASTWLDQATARDARFRYAKVYR